MTSIERAEECVPVFQPRKREEVVCVVFCIPSAETIHQGLGAHYTLNNAQKENENSVSKILCADSQGIVIKALSLHKGMLRQGKTLPQIRQFLSAFQIPGPYSLQGEWLLHCAT